MKLLAKQPVSGPSSPLQFPRPSPRRAAAEAAEASREEDSRVGPPPHRALTEPLGMVRAVQNLFESFNM